MLLVGHDDRVGRRVEQGPVAALGPADPAHEPDEDRPGDRHEQGHGHRGDDEQQVADPASAFTEHAREAVLEDGQLGIDLADVDDDRVDLRGIGIAGLDLGVEAVAIGHDLVDQGVPVGPDRDRLVDVADVAEDPERGDQGRDVRGMVSALGEPGRGDGHVRVGLLQLDTRGLVAARDRDRLEIRLVLRRVLRLGVADEVVDRVLLALAVQALAADVRADARLDLEAHVHDREQADRGDHEQGDAHPQPAPVGVDAAPHAVDGQGTPSESGVPPLATIPCDPAPATSTSVRGRQVAGRPGLLDGASGPTHTPRTSRRTGVDRDEYPSRVDPEIRRLV